MIGDDQGRTEPMKQSQTRISTDESTTAWVVARATPSAPWPTLKPLYVQTHVTTTPNETDFQNPVMMSFISTNVCISPKYVPGERPSSSTPTRYPPKIPTTSKIAVISGN